MIIEVTGMFVIVVPVALLALILLMFSSINKKDEEMALRIMYHYYVGKVFSYKGSNYNVSQVTYKKYQSVFDEIGRSSEFSAKLYNEDGFYNWVSLDKLSEKVDDRTFDTKENEESNDN